MTEIRQKADEKNEKDKRNIAELNLLDKEIAAKKKTLDKQNEEYWENKIMKLAKKHNVDFDLYNQRDDYQVNSIIRGDYYDNMI